MLNTELQTLGPKTEEQPTDLRRRREREDTRYLLTIAMFMV